MHSLAVLRRFRQLRENVLLPEVRPALLSLHAWGRAAAAAAAAAAACLNILAFRLVAACRHCFCCAPVVLVLDLRCLPGELMQMEPGWGKFKGAGTPPPRAAAVAPAKRGSGGHNRTLLTP